MASGIKAYFEKSTLSDNSSYIHAIRIAKTLARMSVDLPFLTSATVYESGFDPGTISVSTSTRSRRGWVPIDYNHSIVDIRVSDCTAVFRTLLGGHSTPLTGERFPLSRASVAESVLMVVSKLAERRPQDFGAYFKQLRVSPIDAEGRQPLAEPRL